MLSPLHILVIAHPDDESMFFAPTVLALERVWVISLSNGNYDGLGRIREKELKQACDILGVEQVFCLNAFEDNPHHSWDARDIAQVLEKTLTTESSSCPHEQEICILTFDKGGVSGHANHTDTYRGVQYWLSSSTYINTKGWKLETISNPLRKYLPPVWLLVCKRESSLEYTCRTPWLVWKAMAAHASQFVWYRRLSVVFSHYTYHNQWHEISIIDV
jgi:N-acetylglucosaminylphosphatidylinositol deacetylase